MVFQNTKKIMKIFLKKILAKNSSQHQLNIIKFHVVEKIQNHIRYMKYHFYYYKKKSFSDRQTRNPNIQWRKSSIINIPCQENGKISRQFWQASKILQRCNCRLNLRESRNGICGDMSIKRNNVVSNCVLTNCSIGINKLLQQ